MCGTLSVFEDRLTGSGRQIPVGVVVVPARNQDGALPDPVFIFAGGPGGAASDRVAQESQILSEVNRDRDLVFVDQRGVGRSYPLHCSGGDSRLGLAENVARYLAALDCDARFYTTPMYTDDVDEVREALGYDRINLRGISYGGFVAQIYLARHGDHVCSVIIDHSVLLGTPFSLVWADAAHLALDRLFSSCEADAPCNAAYPHLREAWAGLLARLTEMPVVADQANPVTGQPVLVDRGALADMVTGMLFATQSAVAVPQLIHHIATTGDVSALIPLAQGRSAPISVEGMPVMFAMTECHEAWAGSGVAPEDVMKAGAHSYYLPNVLDQLDRAAAFCQGWPDPGEAARYELPRPSHVPVLILAGEWDPQNPLEYVQQAPDLWPHAQIVFEPRQGHVEVATPSRCALLNAFIQNPIAPVDASNLAQGLPAFVVSEYRKESLNG